MAVMKLWPSSRRPKQKQAEQALFEQLVQPHLQQLYRLAYRFTGTRYDAEDLVQDILLKLYPRLKEMQDIERLGPWLARVLYRHFIDKYRSKKRSPLHLVGEDQSIINEQPDETPGPAGEFDLSTLQHRLQYSLEQLNEDQRVLVILHDVEGYTLNEIHTMYDVSIGTLKSRLNRARTRLRGLLKNMEPLIADKRVSK